MARRYSRSASKDVERAMRKRKRGTLKSGRSGRKVKSRKQAIAIGLSEARSKEKRSRANPNKRDAPSPLPASELHRFALQVLAERLERRGDDAFGVQAGLGIHRRGRVLVYEDVRQHHWAHFEAAVEHAVGSERVQHVGGEAADGAFLDGDEHLVFAREPKEQVGIERLGEARVGNRG